MVIEAGMKFGKLHALEELKERGARNGKLWACACECGTVKKILATSLRSGNSKSCGCVAVEKTKARVTKHGQSDSLVHHVWRSMKQRCLNPRSKSFPNYGGRGIKVCDRWLVFENFLNDMGPRPEGGTLERVDNDGGYCPENCRWAPRKEQQLNTRRSNKVTAFGETKTTAEWSEDPRCAVAVKALRKRIARGVSAELAISTPSGKLRGEA